MSWARRGVEETVRGRIEDRKLMPKEEAEAVRAARVWCERQGVDNVSELTEAEMEGELVAALPLKNAKQKLLLKMKPSKTV